MCLQLCFFLFLRFLFDLVLIEFLMEFFGVLAEYVHMGITIASGEK